MAELQMAWERQPDDRQWLQPEGDDPRTLYQMLMTSVERFGELNCFGYIPAKGAPRIHLTYNEFAELTTAVGQRLADAGVVTGERVALILDNSVEWAALSYGANGIGAAYTAMYTHQHGDEWAYILNDSAPSMLAVANTAILDKLVKHLPDDAAAWPRCGVILLGDEPANELPPKGIEVHAWAEFVADGRASGETFEVADDPFALNTLIYTSGTTGNPKGVMLTNWNTLSNVLCVQSAFKVYVGDKNAAFLPWAHSFGSTFDLHWMLRCGVHINLISELTRIADECIEIKPAVLLAVPRVWNKFYDRVNSQFEDATGIKKFLIGKAKKSASKRIAKSGIECDAVPATGFFDKLYDKLVWSKVRARFGGEIRFCMSGAAALSPDVAAFIQQVGFSCYEGYGLTETSPLVAANGWAGPGNSRLHCVGRVANGVKVTIDTSAWDGEDKEEGEIIVHGPNVMQGYWNNEEATKEVIIEPGVFRTGDLGKVTPDGYLSITGRVKSQFKLQNGKYVSPAPLEENLKLSPLVEQAVLDGRNMLRTFLIVHPNMHALKAALKGAGVDDSGSDADICSRATTSDWLLSELKEKNMQEPTWKGYERAATLILDPVEWTTDNDMLTPSMKVKLRNLLKHHDEAVQAI